MEETRCHDCGAREGELHHPGCDMERCPFCGGQIITCDCVYDLLKIRDRSKYTSETNYLPPKIYNEGLTTRQVTQWAKILKEKGFIPYIQYPLICAKCGKLWPAFFMVPDEEWEYYIQPDKRRSIICEECYDEIRSLIDKRSGQPSIVSRKRHI